MVALPAAVSHDYCLRGTVFSSPFHHQLLLLPLGSTKPEQSSLHLYLLALAANITFNRPGVGVALVFKPNSRSMASIAAIWLSPGSISLCTSLTIFWQSALTPVCITNEAPFRIAWSSARVRSVRIYKPPLVYRASIHTSPISEHPKTSSNGLSGGGARWAMLCSWSDRLGFSS